MRKQCRRRWSTRPPVTQTPQMPGFNGVVFLWSYTVGKAGTCSVGRETHTGLVSASPSTLLFRPTHWDPLLLEIDRQQLEIHSLF